MTPLSIFRLIAREFADSSDTTVETWLELTRPRVSKRRFGDLYDQALAYLTAHRMKMAGEGDSVMGTIGDSLRVGSYSEGDASIGFNSSQVAGGAAGDADLTLTQYGLEYLNMREASVVSIVSAGET